MKWVLLVAVLVASGCAAGAPEEVATFRDSAGVTIVHSHRPFAPGSIAVDSAPTFDIGGEGTGESEFISQIGSAFRLGDGRIVVSGWAMPVFKIFDSTGHWIATIGRQGGGPGEFQGLGWVYRGPADSLITFEPGRLQWFDPRGQFVRFMTPVAPLDQGNPWIRTIFADGSALATFSFPDSATRDEKVLRSRTVLKRYWPAAARYDSLASYLTGLSLRHPKYRQSAIAELIFTPSISRAAGADRILLTAEDRFEIAVIDLHGTTTRRLRLDATPIPVAEHDRTRAVDWTSSLEPAIRDQVRNDLLAASTAKFRPPFGSIWSATDGSIWVSYADPIGSEPAKVAVFDTTGRWQTDVTLPQDLTVSEIGSNYILGSRQDQLGFHHVILFKLRKI